MKKFFNFNISLLLSFIIGFAVTLCYLEWSDKDNNLLPCNGGCGEELSDNEAHRAECRYHHPAEIYYNCQLHNHGINCQIGDLK